MITQLPPIYYAWTEWLGEPGYAKPSINQLIEDRQLLEGARKDKKRIELLTIIREERDDQERGN